MILSNGNLHYFWDLSHGNPHIITAFPAPNAIKASAKFQPNPARLMSEAVPLDYIARTQMPAYDQEAGWKNLAEREAFTDKNKLRFMRPYPTFGMSDFKAVPLVWRTRIPEYVKDYVPLNQFM